MKKTIILLFYITFSTVAMGQPFTISFGGAGLTYVKVQNLTTGNIVEVPAGNQLFLSSTTDISEMKDLKSEALKVYPNPVNGKSTLKILSPAEGDMTISVCDMTGKVIVQYKGYSANNIQEFSLSGLKSGFHIISIHGKGYQFSGKLLSDGKSDGPAVISKINDSFTLGSEDKSYEDFKGIQAFVDMVYNSGERLKYTATSGNYSTVFTEIPTSDRLIIFNFISCSDGDNNNYPVVQIGTQIWMAENLKTKKYSTGDLIGTTATPFSDITGETSPKYQWAYEGNESYVATYGRLYTWYAVTDSRNVCPVGWHVPTDGEWTILTTYLGGASVAGGKLKETGITHWNSSAGATNETGFTALPGGYRYSGDGSFARMTSYGYWWCSTWNRWIDSGHANVYRGSDPQNFGYSIRCIKD